MLGTGNKINDIKYGVGMLNYINYIKKYLELEKNTLDKLNLEEINEAMNALKSARERSANIYIFGNGGSAASASHFVCDFNKGANLLGQPRFRFQCLSDNTPIITAISNDIAYEDIFVYQLNQILKKEDLIIAISGSGNSKNIVKALQYAKEIGTEIIGITGYSGGEVRKLADYHLHVPLDDMQIAEDIHMIFDHMIMKIFCYTE